MSGRKKNGCLAASFAVAGIGLGISWTVASEVYLKPLGEKLAERWGCLADVDGCLRDLSSFFSEHLWLSIGAAFTVGAIVGLLLASRLRLQGIRFGRRHAKRRKLGHRERALISAAQNAPKARLIVRRNEVPPTILAGTRIFGGVADPVEATAWIAALDRLVSLGRLKDPMGRGEVYDLQSLP